MTGRSSSRGEKQVHRSPTNQIPQESPHRQSSADLEAAFAGDEDLFQDLFQHVADPVDLRSVIWPKNGRARVRVATYSQPGSRRA